MTYIEWIRHNIMLIKKRNQNIIIFPSERRNTDKTQQQDLKFSTAGDVMKAFNGDEQ